MAGIYNWPFFLRVIVIKMIIVPVVMIPIVTVMIFRHDTAREPARRQTGED